MVTCSRDEEGTLLSDCCGAYPLDETIEECE
jgi:hypothetical protein